MVSCPAQHSPPPLARSSRRAFLARVVAYGCCAPIMVTSLVACQSAPVGTTVLPSAATPHPKSPATPGVPATGTLSTPASRPSVRIIVEPITALVDTPVRIQLDGLVA